MPIRFAIATLLYFISSGRRLQRSVRAGMLLQIDRGFYSYEMIERTHARGAHVLGRVPATVALSPRHLLPDGSYWAYIYPADPQRRKRGDHLLVRVIAYTLTHPARPGLWRNPPSGHHAA